MFKVAGGVEIAVDLVPAGVAMECSLRQRQFGLDRTAARAGLARRKPPVSDHDGRSIKPCLVVKLAAQLKEAAIHDRAGEPPVAGHATHVEVFDADAGVSLRQHGRGLVRSVAANGGDAAMKPRQLCLCLAPVGRAFALARQAPARSTQPPQQCLVGLGAGDWVAVAERRQRGQAQIDADRLLWLLDRLDIVGLDHDAGEPAVRLATDGDALQFAGEAHRFAHPHPSHHRQFDPMPVHAEGASLVGGAEAVAAALFLEPGIAPALLEERAERAAQVDDCLLHSAFGDIEHPRKLLALEAVQLTAQTSIGRLRQRWIIGLRGILALPLAQRPVPRKPRRPRSAGKIGPLLVGGVQRDAVGDQHDADSSTARATPSSSFWFLWLREP